MKRNRLASILKTTQVILLILLVGLMVQLNVRTAKQASDTQAIASNTNNIVKKQGEILNAIKTVTDDTRLTAEQQTNIIICMLQVPINQRTTDTQENCRKQATAIAAAAVDKPSQTGQSAPDKAIPDSSSNTTPNNNSSQPNNVQDNSQNNKTPDCTIDILFLHAGACK